MAKSSIVLAQEEDEVLQEVVDKMDEDILGRTQELAEQVNEERRKRREVLQKDMRYIETISDEEVLEQFYNA